MTHDLHIKNNNFTLHPGGAIFWKEKNMLLIADVHLGKVTHFRKHGAAIPLPASRGNFEKLEQLESYFQPETICFLGDLFHSKLNREWEGFRDWAKGTQSKVVLITGNHDILPKYLFEELGVSIHDSLETEGFLLTHHPEEAEGLFNFCGHIHPGIKMRGTGRQFLSLACFYKTENRLILPAFGNFTGKHILKPSEKDEIFAIVEQDVICVSELKN